MSDLHWSTRLSRTTEDGIRIRGYDLNDLIGQVPFASVVYLLFTGDLPEPNVARLIDALMVASIDHGPGTPSALTARTAASGGASLGAAAAAGLLALGKYHGATVQDAFDAIEQVAIRTEKGRGSPEALAQAADSVVAEWRGAGRRISGFGHRQHKRRDPRVDRLFGMAREARLPGHHIAAAEALAQALERSTGKSLPINIDGVIAAILAEIGFPASLSNALFIVARMAGILAQVNEELVEMSPMRRIDPVDIGYSGPPDRQYPDRDSK